MEQEHADQYTTFYVYEYFVSDIHLNRIECKYQICIITETQIKTIKKIKTI